MGQLRTACRTLLLENHTASQVLSALDRVAGLIPGATFTTVFCAILDRSSGAVCYSCAGHLPAIVARANGGTELLDDARGVPLATTDVARPEAGTMLAPGDTVLLYTDGLVERRRCCLDDGIDRAREILADTDGPTFPFARWIPVGSAYDTCPARTAVRQRPCRAPAKARRPGGCRPARTGPSARRRAFPVRRARWRRRKEHGCWESVSTGRKSFMTSPWER